MDAARGVGRLLYGPSGARRTPSWRWALARGRKLRDGGFA